nr:calcium-responsive transcription factor-like isoform X2 [Hydra vulgaris]
MSMDLFLSNYDNNLNISSSEETSSDESESLPADKSKLVYHCKSHEEALQCVKKYEIAATTRFVVFKANKNFGMTEMITKSHSILWGDFAVPYSGLPYIVVASKVFDCHYGFDRNISSKKSYQLKKQKLNIDDHCFQKNYIILQDTKKFMCPAKVNMREIIHFPDFKISERSVWRQKNASKLLREKIKTSALNEINHMQTIVVAIDNLSCHDNHLVGSAELISQKIDPEISKKIEEYVMEGIFNVREMKRLLRIAVKGIFEKENLPPPNNRRFFPRVTTIRSHIVKIKQKLRYSMIDQECLLKKCDEWKKRDSSIKVFLRPKAEITNSICETMYSFLFVYQSLWQQELLLRYGNEILLLDATYRTTRYSLPLFFLAIKTNVDNQVVATFVIENETKKAITEALNIIKQWNALLNPTFCMTDYCNEEIESLEAIFSEMDMGLSSRSIVG